VGSLLKVAAVVVGVVVVVSLIGDIDLNPFGTETKDRSQPVLIKSLERLSEYRAATANLQEIVDIERDAKLLPSIIKGERFLLVAAGSADAGVDFRGIGGKNVTVSEDRESVTLRLPAATLSETRVDLARSRIVDTDRGLLDRVGDAISDDANEERELLLLAQRKLGAAAKADPNILRAAERNTRSMLEGMLRGLGFERVRVEFARPRL
jgi:hypothetical protein